MPFLLQGIFPTQGTNPGVLHGRQILYLLSHKGSPIKMRQQRYAFQTKNKINPQKINETGISNLPRKELKVMIIRMLNKLERRIDEQSENIKENIRMSQNLVQYLN